MKLNKNKYKVEDHKTSLYGMIYNLKKINHSKTKVFYYNEL